MYWKIFIKLLILCAYHTHHVNSLFKNAMLSMALRNNNFMMQQINCVLDKGPCDSIGKKIRAAAPEYFNNFCVRCTQSEKTTMDTIVNYLKVRYPTSYQLIVKKMKTTPITDEDFEQLMHPTKKYQGIWNFFRPSKDLETTTAPSVLNIPEDLVLSNSELIDPDIVNLANETLNEFIDANANTSLNDLNEENPVLEYIDYTNTTGKQYNESVIDSSTNQSESVTESNGVVPTLLPLIEETPINDTDLEINATTSSFITTQSLLTVGPATESSQTELVPTDPLPTHSFSTESLPTESSSNESLPTETLPTKPLPSEPLPTESLLTESLPTESSPTEPLPPEPLPTESLLTESLPTESSSNKSLPTETLPTEPLPPEPLPTESLLTESLPTELSPTEPLPSEPLPTEQLTTEAFLTESLPIAEQLPTESLPTETLPTESLPSEPLPTEQLTTESLPSEPLPTEQLTTEALLTESLPIAEQLPTESLPTETLPTESLPNEPLPPDPLPTEQLPTEALLTESLPTAEQLPNKSLQYEPLPTESLLTEPLLTEPLLTESLPTAEQLPTESLPTESLPTESISTKLLVNESLPNEQLQIEPLLNESLITESSPTESLLTEFNSTVVTTSNSLDQIPNSLTNHRIKPPIQHFSNKQLNNILSFVGIEAIVRKIFMFDSIIKYFKHTNRSNARLRLSSSNESDPFEDPSKERNSRVIKLIKSTLGWFRRNEAKEVETAKDEGYKPRKRRSIAADADDVMPTTDTDLDSGSRKPIQILQNSSQFGVEEPPRGGLAGGMLDIPGLKAIEKRQDNSDTGSLEATTFKTLTPNVINIVLKSFDLIASKVLGSGEVNSIKKPPATPKDTKRSSVFAGEKLTEVTQSHHYKKSEVYHLGITEKVKTTVISEAVVDSSTPAEELNILEPKVYHLGVTKSPVKVVTLPADSGESSLYQLEETETTSETVTPLAANITRKEPSLYHLGGADTSAETVILPATNITRKEPSLYHLGGGETSEETVILSATNITRKEPSMDQLDLTPTETSPGINSTNEEPSITESITYPPVFS